jgi:hypothetical protein
MVSIPAVAAAPTVTRSNPTRRGGWLLIAAFAAVIAFFVVGALIGGDLSDDMDEMAEAAGKSVDDLTATELAQLADDYPAVLVISDVLYVIPFALLTLAVYVLRVALSNERTSTLWNAAWATALAMLVVWVCLRVLSLGLLAGPDDLPPLVRNFDDLEPWMWQATALLGLAAIACMCVALRRSAIVRRLSLVVLVLTGLLLALGISALAFEGEVDPEAPLVMSLILGIGLVLAKPRTAEG